MSDTTTSYDDAQAARRRATTALRSRWSNRSAWQWRWTPFVEAADTCAAIAAETLLAGDVEDARKWAAARQLLRDRVDRGHRDAKRQQAEVVAA